MAYFIFNTKIVETLDWGKLGINLRGRIMKRVHFKVMDHWRTVYLPRHFKQFSRKKYHHDTRSPKYLRRKRRLAKAGFAKDGGGVDNVLTGTFKDLVLNWSKIKAFPSRARLVTFGPRYVTMQPRGGGLPHIWDETTRVTPVEEKKMGQLMMDWLVEEIEQGAKRKRKTTRV
ncbi:hypothetical protein DRH27_05965 [Candidatus Falkowbacteria bacterium]|nr:MAG: hypothetical protein DRH27_05965 [Candidatus Falkowbacteria bacterium]